MKYLKLPIEYIKIFIGFLCEIVEKEEIADGKH